MRRGFTFLETVLVLLVLGIVVLVATPERDGPLHETKIQAASAALDAAMQYAQLAAVSGGRPTRVVVDATANSITVEQLFYAENLLDSTKVEVAGTALDSVYYAPVTHPLKPDRIYRIEFSKEKELEGVDITASSFGPGTPVVFDTRGKASAAGSVNIKVGDVTAQVSLTDDGAAVKLVF